MTETDKALRDVKWAMIQRSMEKINSADFGTTGLPKLKDMLQVGNKLFDDVCRLQAAIIAGTKSAAGKKLATDWLMEVESVDSDMRQKLNERITQLEQGDRRPSAVQPVELVQQQPTILPPPSGLGKFDGTHANWPAFRDLFVALVDSRGYTNLQKLLYLKDACVGAAALAISGYEPLQDCYETAWEQLKWIYDDDFAVAQAMVNRLFDMEPALNGGSAELRRIVDTITSTLRQLTNLKIKVKHWDPIIINLMTRKLPHAIIASWEQHRKREQFPSLKDLIDFLDSMARSRVFDVNKQCSSTAKYPSRDARQDPGKYSGRYDSGRPADRNWSRHARQNADQDAWQHVAGNSKQTAGKNGWSNSAPKSKQTFFQFAGAKASCGYCGNTNHWVDRCQSLQKKTIQERRRELLSLKVCLNCLDFGHFRYNCGQPGCKNPSCSGDKHHTILCEAPSGNHSRPTSDNRATEKAPKRQRTQ